MLRLVMAMMVLAGTAHADDEEDLTSRYTIDGEHGLHIDVTFQRQTGNYHFATHLDLHTATAKLVREADGFESSPQLPLVEKVIAVDTQRWVVIGWSSYGEGMETMAAWLVVADGKKLRITDEVYWTSDRSHTGFVIEDASGKLRLGIPKLPVSKGDDAPHNPGDWELRIGKKTIDLTKLHYATTTTKLFAPPIDESRDVSGPFAWITANGDHFTAK